jgi:glutaconate CoA-transferase, subunit B
MSGEYSLAEMMVIQAARELAGSGRAFVGMGLPMLATALAKYRHDPDLMFITEAGISDWDPPLAEVDHAPFGVADPILDRGASYVGDMVDALGGWLMGGRIDVAVLTGAEVDRFGNLNTLLVGDRAKPDVRLPGTGGNTDAACVAPRVVSIVSLEPRRFVERVSFITSPGYISGPGARRAAGLRPQGENLVVSTMAVFDFDTPDGGETGTCELRVRKLLAGIPIDAVQALLPWDVLVANDVEECAPPDAEELRLLRHLDPGPVYLRPGRY